MNTAWKNLWPDCINFLRDDSRLLEAVDNSITDIITIGQQLEGGGFYDLNVYDIEEVLQSHDAELTINDLIELNQEDDIGEDEQEDDIGEDEQEDDMGEGKQDDDMGEREQEEEGKETHLFTNQNIKDYISMIQKATNFIKSIDPDPKRCASVCKGLKAQIAPYECILEERKQMSKQQALDKFFMSRTSTTTTVTTDVTVEYSSSESGFE
ncbi:hypothetical protein CEXT_204351 [Caerostris extrusa]|uniref:Uncharacterized protein n=1 Tax=Caerostris extrusa TaxID=172846 RepID=A0AAV4SF02_CAEEX|nr:hypothetical protein CEXT_204351 [Caerostris extrusa]